MFFRRRAVCAFNGNHEQSGYELSALGGQLCFIHPRNKKQGAGRPPLLHISTLLEMTKRARRQRPLMTVMRQWSSLLLVLLLCSSSNFILECTAFSTSTKEASGELVSLLLKRRRSETTKSDDERISSLVRTLTDSRAQFDPTICLDGPLYFSNVVDGPPPLWERFGIKLGDQSSAGNIQGQQYRYRDGERGVVNYAEILGKSFHLRAYGTYEKDGDNDEEENATSPFDNVLAFLGGGVSSSSSSLIQCPADFTVTVTKGSFFLFRQRLDIPISGTGYLRVLYADENLRIFVSPKSTTDERWEKAGLTVAQVNIKLIDEGSFEDLCAAC